MAGSFGGDVGLFDRLQRWGAVLTWGVSKISIHLRGLLSTRLLRGGVGLAALSLGDTAGAMISVFIASYVSGPPRGRPASCGHLTWFQHMTPDISLSCRDIERYPGEDESRVHALRGVSPRYCTGNCPRSGRPVWHAAKHLALYILGLLRLTRR